MQISSTAKWQESPSSGRFAITMPVKSPTDKEEVARRLRITRKAYGLKQVALVQRIAKTVRELGGGDLTPQHWNNYEKARDNIPREVVAALAIKLAWPSDWTIYGNDTWLPSHIIVEIERITRDAEKRRA